MFIRVQALFWPIEIIHHHLSFTYFYILIKVFDLNKNERQLKS